MLKLNLIYMMRLRGISSPYSYMKKLGFSHDIARRLALNQAVNFNMNHMEKLCVALYCTPNDLLDYVGESNMTDANHPLHGLKRDNTDLESLDKLSKLTPDKLDQLKVWLDGLE